MADLEIPDGFSLAGGAQIPDGFTQAPSYRGSLLPFSTDQQGNPHLDWSAGLPGQIASAFMAPGNAASGAMPTPYSGGGASASPENINQAINFASIFSPGGATVKPGVPTAKDLLTASNAGYDAVRKSGLDVAGDAVSNWAQGMQQWLHGEKGVIEKNAPGTVGILQELGNPPQGGFIGVPGLMAAKTGLSNLTLQPGTEGFAAKHALGGLRDFMSTLDNPQLAQTATGTAPAASPAAIAQTLRDADANYAAAQRSNDLTGALDKANTGVLERAEASAHASHSGANLDNSIRQRVKTFLQNPSNVAGFSQPEIDALNGLVQGGTVQNATRRVGNLLGGGGGLGAMLTAGAGALLGHQFGSPEIGAMALPAVGMSLKGLENSIARNRLNAVDELIRQRSPLYNAQGMLSQPPSMGGPVPWRGLLPGVLNPQQQPLVPGATPGQPIPAGLLANWS